MVRRALLKVLAVCLLLSSVSRVPVSMAGTLLVLKDKLGRWVRVEVPVKRAVVIVGYEIIPALKAENQVIGVSRWAVNLCDLYKKLVKRYPWLEKNQIGTGVDLNIETIFKLHPDLIITWTYQKNMVDFLTSHGFKVFTIYPDSIKELFKVIETEGILFGKKKRADFVIKETQRLLNFVRNRVKQIPKQKRLVIIHVGMKPNVVACKKGIASELIRLIGGINPAVTINARDTEVSLEKIYAWNPDVIFIWGSAKYGPEFFYSHPEWSFIRAVKNHRIYKLPNWSTWSPRVALIALYMAKKAYPKYFKDVDFFKVAKSFCKEIFGFSCSVTNH